MINISFNSIVVGSTRRRRTWHQEIGFTGLTCTCVCYIIYNITLTWIQIDLSEALYDVILRYINISLLLLLLLLLL